MLTAKVARAASATRPKVSKQFFFRVIEESCRLKTKRAEVLMIAAGLSKPATHSNSFVGAFLVREMRSDEHLFLPKAATCWKACTHVMELRISRSRVVRILLHDTDGELARDTALLLFAHREIGKWHSSFPWSDDVSTAIEVALFGLHREGLLNV